jgi:hypothetical protein
MLGGWADENGLLSNGDSRDAMDLARMLANLPQEQAPREAEPQVVSLADRASVEVKKSELAARVMMFSMKSGQRKEAKNIYKRFNY